MLHEILLALLGHTGSIVIEVDKQFKVSNSIDFLTDAEIEQINKVVVLGVYFKQISSFVKRNGGLNSQLPFILCMEDMKDENDDEEIEVTSVYVKSFCAGVYEVLNLYKEHILAIEHEYFVNDSLNITHLSLKLSLFYQLFPALNNCVYEIENQDLKGGQLLDLIYQNCNVGNPIIKSMFTKILFYCNKVLYHQINAWIVHGQLLDISDEFFIHMIDKSLEELDNAQNKDPNKTVKDSANSSVLSVGSNVTFYRIKNILGKNLQEDENEWNNLFTLRLSMLPHSYFPSSLASKILFIGKAVRMLQSKKTSEEDRIQPEDLKAFSAAISKLQSIKEFNLPLFSKVINTIGDCVAKKLWNLVVVKADLLTHLKTMKDFFLLANGEFYQLFVEESRNLMALPPSSKADIEVNQGPYLQTKNLLGKEDDEIFKKFKFRMRSFSFNFKDFRTRMHLSCPGAVYQARGSTSLRIAATRQSRRSGAIWHSFKQKIDTGFKSSFNFKIKNPIVINTLGGENPNMSIMSGSPFGIADTPAKSGIFGGGENITPFTNRISQEDYSAVRISTGGFLGVPQDTGVHQTDRISVLGEPTEMNPIVVSCVIILQGEKDVNASKHSAPISTRDLSQYIAIKFTSTMHAPGIGAHSVYSSKFKGPLNITNKIELCAVTKDMFANTDDPFNRDTRADSNHRIIESVELNDVDFVDGEQHTVKIEYDKETLKIYVDQLSETPALCAALSIGEQITLDNGSCYIGIAQETFLTNNMLEIFNWSLMSSTQSFSKDSWSGLSLEYKAQWPVHLFISPEVIEQYNKLFRFLFPLRRVQIDLQNDWKTLKRVYYFFDESQMRFVLAMRAKLNAFINNVMSYLQLDVIETQWNKLYKGIEKCEDFEEARKLHDNYLSILTNKFFLSMQKIIKTMQDLSHLIMRFSMQCKLIVEDAHKKEALTINNEESKFSQERKASFSLPQNIFREINDIKDEFSILSKLIFKILNKKKGIDNSNFLSQLF